MSLKKAKSKGKAKANSKSSGTRRVAKPKKQVDLAKVRESINNLVGASAKVIASEVIKVARKGQLAPAKYLFEAVGLYPPTEQTEAPLQKDSLAQTLLARMGLPLEPVIRDEDAARADATSTAAPIGAAEKTAAEKTAAEETGGGSPADGSKLASGWAERTAGGERGETNRKDTVE